MNRIERMVAEMCPDGVEFLPLGDLVTIKNGADYKRFAEGSVPVYGSGGLMTRIDHAVYGGPSVLIPRKGSLGNLFFVDEPFWTVDTIFYTIIGERLVPKFLYYFLLRARLDNLNQAGGVPSLTQSVLKVLRIPVPPIEIQWEIVDILDSFTKLEAELEAELEARRAQCAFYRDRLLSFDFEAGGGCSLRGLRAFEVRWALMGELGTLLRGRRFTLDDFRSEGMSAIHYGEIYTRYGAVAHHAVTRIDSDLRMQLRFASPGEVIIACVGETVEDLGRGVAWLGEEAIAYHDDSVAWRTDQDPRYLSYFLRSRIFDNQKGKLISRAKVKRISPKALLKVKVPIPPLQVQRRIADVLDDFDALVNDLSFGLPAEIAARRQQYEYYRDRLLTFPEKK